jgi:GNAT superfamily N-acetyltransferase
LSTTRSDVDVDVRPYRDTDAPDVIELLQITMGDGPAGLRTREFFEWKHLENPFGRSLMLVAVRDGQIVGLRAFMRWRFRSAHGAVRAVQAVDTATHPDYQGMGIFSRLTRTALEMLSEDTDLVFNTPNEKSLPGYLKMGWRSIGRFPVSVRVRRPVRVALGLRGASRDTGVISPRPAVDAKPVSVLLAECDIEDLLGPARASRDVLLTDRTVEYVGWRYARPPGLEYRAVSIEKRGRLRGAAIFRVRPRGPLWEADVVEVLASQSDAATIRSLLRGVARSARVDHLAAHFPRGSETARAARRAGFLRSPIGIDVVVKPLRPALAPNPTSVTSWAFSLGDLEVF